MPDQPLVSIVTVHYGAVALTHALLDSVRRLNDPRLEVVVVDNGSDTAEGLQARYPEVRVVRSERNLGFAGGNNLGMREARGRYFFFVNNDAEVTPGCIDRLVALAEGSAEVGAVSPLLCFYPDEGAPVRVQYAGATRLHPLTGRNRTLGRGDAAERWHNAPSRPTAYAHGAAMLVPRAVVERVGGMREDYFLYYEELDWCARMHLAGYSVWVAPAARVYHKESMTVGRASPLKTYYLTRNRALFMRRFAAWPLAFGAYLLLVAAPRHALACLWRRDAAGWRAFMQALAWHAGYRNNTFERYQTQRNAQQPLAAAV
jgi:GT2 family glycosyltransferase